MSSGRPAGQGGGLGPHQGGTAWVRCRRRASVAMFPGEGRRMVASGDSDDALQLGEDEGVRRGSQWSTTG
jgi:hypothetical protein